MGVVFSLMMNNAMADIVSRDDANRSAHYIPVPRVIWEGSHFTVLASQTVKIMTFGEKRAFSNISQFDYLEDAPNSRTRFLILEIGRAHV